MGGAEEPVIRNWVAEDRSQIESLCCAPYGEHWCETAEKVLRESPEAIADGELDASILVATEVGAVLGAIVFGREPGQPERDIIYSLGVLRERHRQGIGFRLKQAVLAINAAAKPPRIVVSRVHRANFRMVALNEKLLVGTIKDPDDGEFLFTAAQPEPEESDCGES